MGAVVGAVVNTVITVADAVIHDKPIDVGDILISATTGVASGALAANGAG